MGFTQRRKEGSRNAAKGVHATPQRRNGSSRNGATAQRKKTLRRSVVARNKNSVVAS